MKSKPGLRGLVAADPALLKTCVCCPQFYLDFVGKLSDENVQNAMRHLQETAPFVRVLGSFPMDTDLGSMNVETMFDKWANNGGPGAAAAQEVVL